MEENFDPTLLRWASILMVAGGIAFWIGAFIPPYKQWMTSDVKEYLSIIDSHRINWYLIHTPMLIGVIATSIALQLFSKSFHFTSQGILYSTLSANLFLPATVILVISFVFRLTVTTWVVQQFTETGAIEPWYKTWQDWSTMLFGIYMVLAYLSSLFLGLALRDIPFVPNWLFWFCLIFGIGGSIGYPAGFLAFEPPLMIHLPFIIVGIVLIMKL